MSLAERWLAPISEEEARELFEPGGFAATWKRLKRTGQRAAQPATQLELFFLPHALVVAPIGQGGGAREGSGQLFCLVCLSSGRVARVEPAHQSFLASPMDLPPSTCLPKTLDQEQVIAAARDFLLRVSLVLRREKQRIAVSQCRLIEFWQYPYWAEIYERRRERFDLRSLDAVTQKPAGAANRGVLLDGLIREHRSRTGAGTPSASTSWTRGRQESDGR